MDKDLLHIMKKELTSWLLVIIFAVAAATLITNVLIVNAKVPSGSMENTIMTNDRVIANRLAYIAKDPERFDIVVFPAPDTPEILFVKRIIGLPGETLQIKNGEVYVNDSKTPLESSFVLNDLSGDFGPYEIPDDSYFMLGDNRLNSKDARYWENKFVPRDKLLGKVVVRYFRGFKIY